jgi:pyruvate formate lyase activating enzyme
MVIGGLVKASLIDYPGKMSCVLFLSGCNFGCPYCHNPDLARGRAGGPPLGAERFFAFLRERTGFLDGVVISGGEPTLHEDLPSVCRKIREIGYSLKLDTNGSRPEMIRSLLRDGLVDFIAMDIKTDPEAYHPVFHSSPDAEPVLESIRLIMNSGIDYEFRVTCVKPFIDPEILGRICRVIRGADVLALQHFKETEVLRPELFEGKEAGFTEAEFGTLAAIARAGVRECLIR